MKQYYSILICILFFIWWLGCDGKSSISQPEINTDQINWVSTSVLYDTTIVKKDYSLILFTASWCGWCNKLERETLTDSAVIVTLNGYYNCVRIDPYVNSQVIFYDSLISPMEFARLYDVTGFPTICFLNYAGVVIGHAIGYKTPNELTGILDTIRTGAYDP